MIDFTTYKQHIDRIRADIKRNLPGVDPTIFGTFERAFADSLAGRAFDVTNLQEQLVLQLFPQTSTGVFLELWAAYEGLFRIAAVGATGPVTFLGAIGSIIPQSTQVKDTNGNLFETALSVTISGQVISVTSLTRSGNIVTVKTPSDHLLGSGQELAIVGAIETDYNGTQTITVTASDEFTYLITTTPTTPATGTITAEFDGGFVDVNSVGVEEVDNSVNLGSGATLNLVTPILGVNATGIVQFGEVGGGAATEEDPSLLARTLQSRANPVANFNVAAITKQLFAVPGITRVLVKRITPYIGATTILFVRDGDANIIPSASEVATAKDAVVELLPAPSSVADVFVTAPTPVSTDYTFSALSPDTPTMRDAVSENLEAFYQDEVSFETDITEDKYRAAIINTIDPETGDSLDFFTLSSPSGNISVATDEIGVLGDIILP